MKKLLLLIVLFCTSLITIAQDVIVKKDGSIIQSKVMEINGAEIKYRKWSNLEGPIYSINQSEVLSINYQNGEVEMFNINEEEPQVQEKVIKGWMEREGRNLVLDGRKLTDDEIRELIGEKNYQNYLSLQGQFRTSNAFKVILVASLLIGTTSIISMANGKENTYNSITLLVSAISANISIPLLSVFDGIGKGRLSRIADDYNEKGTQVSYFFSPSIMRADKLGQNNLGLGLTFSVNFKP